MRRLLKDSRNQGISKLQSSDNVLAFIPNAQSREVGVLRAKLLKTRDSGGVGSYVDFKTDWKTLSFIPFMKEDGGGAPNWQANAHSNLPSQRGTNATFEKKPTLKKPEPDNKPKAVVKADKEGVDADSDLTNNDDGEKKSTASVIKGIKGKPKLSAKKIKLQSI